MPSVFRYLVAMLTVAVVSCGTIACLAAGGTSKVATQGHPVSEDPHWPPGVAALLAHPTRADGWNSWFTEWPNDVDHYEFHVTNTDQLNEIIARFGEIEVWKEIASTEEPGKIVRRPFAVHRQPPVDPEIRLCPLAEPTGFGWVSRFEAGNGIPVIFTIGDQHRMDQWYQHFLAPKGGQFGVMKFADVPVAVPPTLTIFVANEAVDLDRLEIPERINVSMGYLPGLWHVANVIERERPERQNAEQQERVTNAADEVAAEQMKLTTEAITKFLTRRD